MVVVHLCVWHCVQVALAIVRGLTFWLDYCVNACTGMGDWDCLQLAARLMYRYCKRHLVVEVLI